MKRLACATMVLLIALTVSASAIDFDARITNLDGSDPKDEKGQSINLTVGTVCVNSLMTPPKVDVPGEEKIRRAVLAQRIQRREDYKYTAEDIALVKKLVNDAYPSPLIVFQTWEALERK